MNIGEKIVAYAMNDQVFSMAEPTPRQMDDALEILHRRRRSYNSIESARVSVKGTRIYHVTPIVPGFFELFARGGMVTVW